MKRLILFCLLGSAIIESSAMKDTDSLKQTSIKLDLIPFYHLFFDVREQYRLAFEVQKISTKKFFYSVHLDAGVYDKYAYYKYYDFFAPNSSIYYIKQDVKTYGFQSLYSLYRGLKGKWSSDKTFIYGGVTADFNLFEKKTSIFNSKTLDKSNFKNHQGRLGLGLNLGIKKKLLTKVSLEFKSILVFNIVTFNSDAQVKKIKPYKSVWFNKNQSLWYIPQLNICYDL